MSTKTVRQWLADAGYVIKPYMESERYDPLYTERWYKYTDDEEEFIIIRATLHGDYVGSDISAANHRSMKKRFGKVKAYDEGRYSYSTRCTAFAADRFMSWQKAAELIETLERLEGYPLIDEDDWSEVQDEYREEAWDSWTRNDFRKQTGFDVESYWGLYDVLDNLFPHLHLDGYEHFETGTTMYLNVDKLVEDMEKEGWQHPREWDKELSARYGWYLVQFVCDDDDKRILEGLVRKWDDDYNEGDDAVVWYYAWPNGPETKWSSGVYVHSNLREDEIEAFKAWLTQIDTEASNDLSSPLR